MSAFVPRFALAAGHSAGRRRAALPLLLLVISLALILSAFEAARPAPALALSTFATKCDGVVLRSRPSTTSSKHGDPVQGDQGRRRGQGVRQQLADHLRGIHLDRQQLVQDHGRQRQGRPQPVRLERRVRRVQPVQEALLDVLQEGGLRRRQRPHERLDRRDEEGEPVRGHERHRDRHRLRRQLERDLCRRRRLGLVLVQDQPGQRQEHRIAVRRLGDLRREGPVHEPQLGHACVEPQPHAAAQLDPGPHADAVADERLHRGHRRQPLAGDDRLGQGGRRGQEVRVHQGDRVDRLPRQQVRDEPRPGEGQRHQGRRLPLRPPRHEQRTTRSTRPTGSSRTPARSPASCSRSSTSR